MGNYYRLITRELPPTDHQILQARIDHEAKRHFQELETLLPQVETIEASKEENYE